MDFENGWVTLDPDTTKNSEGRVFPFTLELRELPDEQRRSVEELQRKKGTLCPWVFHRNGKPIKSFYKAWDKSCETAGLPGRIPNDFRGSAVRNLVRAGVPERVDMTMTGHKTRSVFKPYNIVSEGNLRSAAERLSGAMGNISGKVATFDPKNETDKSKISTMRR